MARPASIATSITSSIKPELADPVASTASTTPMPSPQPTAMGMLRNLAMEAAASPRTSSDGPRVSGVSTLPSPRKKIAEKAATAPARPQAIRAMCSGLTPARVAASGFTAAARMPIPAEL